MRTAKASDAYTLLPVAALVPPPPTVHRHQGSRRSRAARACCGHDIGGSPVKDKLAAGRLWSKETAPNIFVVARGHANWTTKNKDYTDL
jgi:hypothetical protein